MTDNTNDSIPDGVWPPPITHQPVDTLVVLTKAQRNYIRNRWLHLVSAFISIAAGANEYLSTSQSWWHSPPYKAIYFGLVLFVFIGNLWRAIQGWHLKAISEKLKK